MALQNPKTSPEVTPISPATTPPRLPLGPPYIPCTFDRSPYVSPMASPRTTPLGSPLGPLYTATTMGTTPYVSPMASPQRSTAIEMPHITTIFDSRTQSQEWHQEMERRSLNFMTRTTRWRAYPETLTPVSWSPTYSPATPPITGDLDHILEDSGDSDTNELAAPTVGSSAATMRATTPRVICDCGCGSRYSICAPEARRTAQQGQKGNNQQLSLSSSPAQRLVSTSVATASPPLSAEQRGQIINTARQASRAQQILNQQADQPSTSGTQGTGANYSGLTSSELPTAPGPSRISGPQLSTSMQASTSLTTQALLQRLIENSRLSADMHAQQAETNLRMMTLAMNRYNDLLELMERSRS